MQPMRWLEHATSATHSKGWGHFLVLVARLPHQIHASFPRLGTACLSLPFLFSKICVRVGDQFEYVLC